MSAAGCGEVVVELAPIEVATARRLKGQQFLAHGGPTVSGGLLPIGAQHQRPGSLLLADTSPGSDCSTTRRPSGSTLDSEVWEVVSLDSELVAEVSLPGQNSRRSKITKMLFGDTSVASFFQVVCCRRASSATVNVGQKKVMNYPQAELRIFGRHTANARWAEVFGSSSWVPCRPAYVALRLGLALLFQALLLWSILRGEDELLRSTTQDWLVYLIRWSLAVQTAYVTIAAYTTLRANEILDMQEFQVGGWWAVGGEEEEETVLPVFARIAWILLHTALPASLTVTVLHWACPLFSSSGSPTMSSIFQGQLQPFSSFRDFGYGGLSFILLAVDLLVGKVAFSVRQLLWFLGYSALVCAGWTAQNAYLKTNAKGRPHELEEDNSTTPIYAAVIGSHGGHLPKLLLVVFLMCCVALLVCERPISRSWISKRRSEPLASNEADRDDRRRSCSVLEEVV